MSAAILDERFILHEGGRTIPGNALIQEATQQREGDTHVNIVKDGVKGLILGLLAMNAGQSSLSLIRDPAAPPISTPEAGMIRLQTSGTTGTPKWIAHRLGQLTAGIATGSGGRARWLLSFNPGSFAGLQVILSAMKGGHDLVVGPSGAGIAELAALARREQVTHISGTPTFWRAFLMALGEASLPLKSVTLGGEAADQPILDALKARFPHAQLRHIYATTEAGVVFSVSDGCAGFPRSWLETGIGTVRLALSDNRTLMVARGGGTQAWDTGDIVTLTEDRVSFSGRIDSMVNVGGVKVHPEEVEAFILQLDFVQDVKISAKPNPITGHILTADIVLKAGGEDFQKTLRTHLSALPRAKRPASLRFVDRLEIGATGKKIRVPNDA